MTGKYAHALMGREGLSIVVRKLKARTPNVVFVVALNYQVELPIQVTFLHSSMSFVGYDRRS